MQWKADTHRRQTGEDSRRGQSPCLRHSTITTRTAKGDGAACGANVDADTEMSEGRSGSGGEISRGCDRVGGSNVIANKNSNIGTFDGMGIGADSGSGDGVDDKTNEI